MSNFVQLFYLRIIISSCHQSLFWGVCYSFTFIILSTAIRSFIQSDHSTIRSFIQSDHSTIRSFIQSDQSTIRSFYNHIILKSYHSKILKFSTTIRFKINMLQASQRSKELNCLTRVLKNNR